MEYTETNDTIICFLEHINDASYFEERISNKKKEIKNGLEISEINFDDVSKIEILKKGDLSFFNDETELVTTFIKELKEEIPEKLNTPSIQARISVLETCFFKLEGIKNLKNIDKKTILSFIKEVLVSHSNLILQINKKFEQESQKIEKP